MPKHSPTPENCFIHEPNGFHGIVCNCGAQYRCWSTFQLAYQVEKGNFDALVEAAEKLAAAYDSLFHFGITNLTENHERLELLEECRAVLDRCRKEE